MPIKKLEEMLKINKKEVMKLVVVACHDEEVIKAVMDSNNLSIAEPILIGDKIKTKQIAKRLSVDISKLQIIDERDFKEASKIGVQMISDGEADFIMKGLVDTATLLKAVLNKEWGLRTKSLLSHVMVYEIPDYSKLIYLTDGGMNIDPSLEDKVKIIENAGIVVRALGKKNVNIACLAAKEKVDPKMIATVHADKLKLLYKEGKFSEGIRVDGPMALDLAISKKSAKIKGYKSELAGDADVLLVPNIEMGNGIGKSISYFAKGKSAGIIMGAKTPIVLTSRADEYKTKLYSIALGSLIAGYLKESNE